MRSQQLGNKVKIALIEMPDDKDGRWTQARIAKLHGVNKDVFSRFVRGEAGLPDDKITAIAKTLDASFEIDTDGIHYVVNPDGAKKY